MIHKVALPPATIIINFHREGVYAHKTLLGFLRIREYSASFGNRVDLICVLDNSDALTKQIVTNLLKEYGTKYDQIIETSFGTPSAARNVGIDFTKTEYVGFNDGDDFFSANRVEEMLKAQLNNNNPSLYFPEKIISFGNKVESFIIQNSQDIPLLQAVNVNFWPYSSFGHIKIYKSHPYNERVNKNSRLAYEDWDFNLRCLASDISLISIKDTYLFYRRRDNSVLSEHNSFKSFVPASDFFSKVQL